MRPFAEDGGLAVVRSGRGEREGEGGQRAGQKVSQIREQQGERRTHRGVEVQR